MLDGAGNLITGYTYDSLGRISMETFGNGTKTVYSYDAAGREASISNLDAGGIVTTSTTYTYSALNLPLTATDQAGNVTTYTYDARWAAYLCRLARRPHHHLCL